MRAARYSVYVTGNDGSVKSCETRYTAPSAPDFPAPGGVPAQNQPLAPGFSRADPMKSQRV